uniref:Uncharacterized protein n=1 Tax=viral metagenome TaxID=1070528 RepID=A0A6M3KIR8_9ZZZZ
MLNNVQTMMISDTQCLGGISQHINIDPGLEQIRDGFRVIHVAMRNKTRTHPRKSEAQPFPDSLDRYPALQQEGCCPVGFN